MRLRDIAAMRQDNIIKNTVNNKFTSAGLPTANFGKPFSYIKSCVPGGVGIQSGTVNSLVGSQRSNQSNDSASSKTRQFMMSLNQN